MITQPFQHVRRHRHAAFLCAVPSSQTSQGQRHPWHLSQWVRVPERKVHGPDCRQPELDRACLVCRAVDEVVEDQLLLRPVVSRHMTHWVFAPSSAKQGPPAPLRLVTGSRALWISRQKQCESFLVEFVPTLDGIGSRRAFPGGGLFAGGSKASKERCFWSSLDGLLRGTLNLTL